MLHDLEQGTQHQDSDIFDVCIAGGGMAGLTLAVSLAKKGRRVLVVEGGARDYEDRSQSLYRGKNVGRSYFDLDTARLRFLGGSSNHWGGWCRPLDEIDFKPQDQIPLSGWPIDYSDLAPYQQAVADTVGIENDFDNMRMPASSPEIQRIRMQFSAPPLRFGELFLKDLEENPNIALYLNANLVDIRIDETNGAVSAFQVVNYADKNKRIPMKARYFVLALGGIENPRLLMASRSQISTGIGNTKDLVGRYFCEHIHVLGGYYAAEKASWPFQSAEHDVFLAPTPDFQMHAGIANARVGLQTLDPELNGGSKEYVRSALCSSEWVRDFIWSFRRFDCNVKPTSGGYLRVSSEQVPNPRSRVYLTEELDALGMPTLAMDWQLLDIDRRTVLETIKAVGKYLARNNYGNVRLAQWVLEDGEIPGVANSDWTGAGWHHMGTTRMAASAEAGVVDKDLKVFGHDNLFITGTSVFPTGGYANPSFTMLQLTLRLSDHLDGLLA